jgi:hypothetical protein
VVKTNWFLSAKRAKRTPKSREASYSLSGIELEVALARQEVASELFSDRFRHRNIEKKMFFRGNKLNYLLQKKDLAV